jgi:hypothetical protein
MAETYADPTLSELADFAEKSGLVHRGRERWNLRDALWRSSPR